MDRRISNEFEQIDRKTLRAVCDGVGERLQQYIRPENVLTPRLQQFELLVESRCGAVAVG
jgi:hypothetical protein